MGNCIAHATSIRFLKKGVDKEKINLSKPLNLHYPYPFSNTPTIRSVEIL